MIVLHASFPINPEKREQAIELTDDLVEGTNQEDGAIEYRATVDLQDENVIRFIERYEDAAALEAHAETAHYQAFGEHLPDLLDGEPEVLRFDVESMEELEL